MKYKIKSVLKNIGFCSTDIEYISDDIICTYNLSERGYHGIKHILDSALTKFQMFASLISTKSLCDLSSFKINSSVCAFIYLCENVIGH